MMAGEWPTFQCGTRRTGKALSFAYVIAELPNFYSGTGTPTAWHVNRQGHAVGQAHGYYAYPYGSQFGYCAAQWKNLTLTGYGGAYGIADSFASAINLHGDAAGYSYYGPLVWAAGAGSGQSLPLPGGYYGSGAQATGIAEDRTIVGYGANGSGTQVLRWLYDGSGWSGQPAQLFSPGGQAQAYGVSEGGRIAGRAKFTAGGPWRAFKTDQDPQQIEGELGTFGGTESWAWDIHEASGAVGWAHNSAGRRRAFYVPIESTALQELPRLAGTAGTTYQGEAYGVTHLGEVVGTIQNDANAYRAFYYTPGASAVVDLGLTPLATGGTPASQGWTLTSANAISESGVIVGQGVRSGLSKAWILYPQCQE
jgi:probable HAF family extracellular repeat protein